MIEVVFKGCGISSVVRECGRVLRGRGSCLNRWGGLLGWVISGLAEEGFNALTQGMQQLGERLGGQVMEGIASTRFAILSVVAEMEEKHVWVISAFA